MHSIPIAPVSNQCSQFAGTLARPTHGGEKPRGVYLLLTHARVDNNDGCVHRSLSLCLSAIWSRANGSPVDVKSLFTRLGCVLRALVPMTLSAFSGSLVTLLGWSWEFLNRESSVGTDRHQHNHLDAWH
jgi:hypothetical protein